MIEAGGIKSQPHYKSDMMLSTGDSEKNKDFVRFNLINGHCTQIKTKKHTDTLCFNVFLSL